MLFHVTATHSDDNCPGYNLETIPEVLKALEGREAIAREQKVKLVGMWSAAPEHTFYMLIESDNLSAIDQFCTRSAPFKQGYRVTPVISADELIQLAKEYIKGN